MENRTLEKITTILTNLENKKKNENAKINAMFEEYKLKANNSMGAYLEFENEYTEITKNFDKKFPISAVITPEETSELIDYKEVIDIFGKSITDYFFSLNIKFVIPTNTCMYLNMESVVTSTCVLSRYCKRNDIINNGWDWIQKSETKDLKSCGLEAILIEYLDVLYPLFEQKMLEDINIKYSEDLNNVCNTRVLIEKTFNALKSNKEKRTDSIRNIIIQRLQESIELCEKLIDKTSYAMAHITLTDYAIERAINMSDTDLELIYNDIMNIEEN